jgi:ferrochelatase
VGLPMERVATPGADPRFARMAVELVRERLADGDTPDGAPGAPALGMLGPRPATCAPGCCPNPRGPRPALCGSDPA